MTYEEKDKLVQGTQEEHRGVIDCVHVWRRVLTVAETEQHQKDHENGKCPGKYPDEI